MLALHDWQNFYILTGTAAATLTGLLFIAVSIGSNLPLQQTMNNLRTFVNPTLFYYVQVLFVSCFTLMPLSSLFIFSGVIAILGLVNVFLALKIFWRMRVLHDINEIDLGHWVWHILLPVISGLILVSSSIGFFFVEQLAMLGLSIAVLLYLGIGLRNTWELTIWLALRRREPHDSEDLTQNRASSPLDITG